MNRENYSFEQTITVFQRDLSIHAELVLCCVRQRAKTEHKLSDMD